VPAQLVFQRAMANLAETEIELPLDTVIETPAVVSPRRSASQVLGLRALG
jgi:hypothetical protein